MCLQTCKCRLLRFNIMLLAKWPQSPHKLFYNGL